MRDDIDKELCPFPSSKNVYNRSLFSAQLKPIIGVQPIILLFNIGQHLSILYMYMMLYAIRMLTRAEFITGCGKILVFRKKFPKHISL